MSMNDSPEYIQQSSMNNKPLLNSRSNSLIFTDNNNNNLNSQSNNNNNNNNIYDDSLDSSYPISPYIQSSNNNHHHHDTNSKNSPLLNFVHDNNSPILQTDDTYASISQQQQQHQQLAVSSNFVKIIIKVTLYLSYIWMGFIYFSLLSEFPAIIYYYNMDKMNYPSLLLVLFYIIPMLLLNSKTIINMHIAIPFGLSIPSCLTVLWATNHIIRSITVGWGVMFMSLGWGQTWCHIQHKQREMPQYALLSGLVLLVLVRYHNYSINPLWTSKEFGICAVVFSSLACMILIWHRYLHDKKGTNINNSFHYMSAPSTPIPVRQMYFVIEEEAWDDEDMELYETGFSQFTWMRNIYSGLAFGCCLFLLQFFFSSYTTISRWAGYEPFPSCLLIFMAFIIGLPCSTLPILTHPFTWPLAIMSVVFLCFGTPALVLIGGVILSMMISALWLSTIYRIPNNNAGFSLTFGILIYLILLYSTLASVESQRMVLSIIFFNRLWLVPSFALCGLIIGLYKKPKKLSMELTFAPRLPFIVIFIMVMFGQLPSSVIRFSGRVPVGKSSGPMVIVPVGFALPTIDSLQQQENLYDENFDDDKQKWSNPVFSVVQLDVNAGFDSNGLLNFQPISDYISLYQPDIIALQEAQANYLFAGNNDPVEYISWNCGYYSYVAPSARVPTLSSAILTQDVQYKRRVIKLPTETENQLYYLLMVETITPQGDKINVFTTKLSHMSSLKHLQALAIANEIKSYITSTTLLIGDFADYWNAKELKPISDSLSSACHHVWKEYVYGPEHCGYTDKFLNVSDCGYDTHFNHVKDSPLWTLFKK